MFGLWGKILPNDLTLLEDNDAKKSTSQMSYFCRINQGINCEY